MFFMGQSHSKNKQSSPQKIDKQIDYAEKVNLANLYNKNEDFQIGQYQRELNSKEDIKKTQKFRDLMNEKIIDINALRNLAWSGISNDFRSQVWKILLRYQSTNRDAQFSIIDRKRTQYYEMCEVYFSKETAEFYDEREKKIIKLIQQDVLRNKPGTQVFRNLIVQGMLKRILFIWNVRNPACGYVQGINDIVSVFLVVFLADYVDINLNELSFENEKQMDHLDIRLSKQVEADSYWCLSKMLDCVIDNYTQDQPGQVRQYTTLWEQLQKLDKSLCEHLENQKIDLYRGFIFKWNNCLLLRLFQSQVGIRLFDTLIAEDLNYFEFCMYILTSILLKYSKKLQQMPFDEIMSYLEKLPTKDWSEYELNLCLAEAYSYKLVFGNK